DHIISNPFGYVLIFIRSLFEYLPDYLYMFIGGKLGWTDTLLSPFIILYYYLVLFMAMVFEPLKEQRLSSRQRFLCIALFTINAVFIITLLYVYGTAVGAGIIGCVHGRYFIPIALLFFLPWYGRFNFLFEHKSDWHIIMPRFATIMTAYSISFLSYALYTVVMRYYF
ncbi:MAG: DUF2142 domain-containing protein, partial [Candidatus Omnitrophica bacterium]|nr:DUF2142 domain-containing protein [Candidatus Omnitrophota bacterium]